MRARKSARPAPGHPKPTLLYLGCFSLVEPGDPEREGTFQIVAEAQTVEAAVETFRRRLDFLRDTTTLFNDPVTIYLDGVVQLSGSFKNGLLVNYQAGDAPPPPNAVIMCTIPEQKDHQAVDYGWKPAKKGVTHFVDYGGERFQESVARLQKSKGGAQATFHASTSRATSEPPASKKTPSDAKADRARKAAEREAEAKRGRERAALEATLAELEGKRASPRRVMKPRGPQSAPKK